MNLFYIEIFLKNAITWLNESHHTQFVILRQWTTLLHKGPLKIYWSSHSNFYQGTIYRNAQLRYTHIMYCERNVNKPSAPTEVEGEGLQLRCDITVQQKTSKYIKLERIHMIFGFLVNMENSIAIYSYFTPWALFPQKIMRCPWILCFDLLSLQYTDLTHEIWRFLVYIFLDSNHQIFKTGSS